jgi:hypothetical protein
VVFIPAPVQPRRKRDGARQGLLRKVLGEQRLQVAVKRRDAFRRRLAPMITMKPSARRALAAAA